MIAFYGTPEEGYAAFLNEHYATDTLEMRCAYFTGAKDGIDISMAHERGQTLGRSDWIERLAKWLAGEEARLKATTDWVVKLGWVKDVHRTNLYFHPTITRLAWNASSKNGLLLFNGRVECVVVFNNPPTRQQVLDFIELLEANK